MADKGDRNPKRIGKLSLVLIMVGVMLMCYPLFTYVYGWYEQNRLQASLAERDSGPAEHRETGDGGSDEFDEEPAVAGPSPLEAALSAEFTGALIEIPALGVSAAVVRGTSLADLRKGPGWYEESALPGSGNTAIAGHRTTYGAWFRNVDQLKAGDIISLRYAERNFLYKVERVFPIASNDWSVIEPCGYPALTLTTCHPVGSAAQRLVVRAALVHVVESSRND